jgi:hypothetical protein
MKGLANEESQFEYNYMLRSQSSKLGSLPTLRDHSDNRQNRMCLANRKRRAYQASNDPLEDNLLL